MRGPKEPRRGTALHQLSIIQDGSLLIQDGVLVEVGATRRVENLALARHATEVSAAGRVVMPGFVDSHTHLLFPPGLSSPEAPPSESALRAIPSVRLKARARAVLEAMARHGTTTVEVKTSCGADEGVALKILRVLAELKHEPLDVVPTVLFCAAMAPGSEETRQPAWRQLCERLLPKVQRRRFARFADVRSQDDACFSDYLEAVRRLGLGRKVHADHAAPAAAVTAAIEKGAASIDHLEHITPTEAARLGPADAIATLLPCASFHGAGRFAPARTLIDAGAAVALATNYNPRHTPTLNMQTAVSLACRYLHMTLEEAVSAATINGAHALACASHVGSLEPGKSADLVVLSVSDYRELASGFGANLVQMTMKRGEFIYEEGGVAPRPPQELRPSW